MTLTFWHIFCFLQVYILANTSLKLIFSVNAIKFEKIFHIFLHLQNMEEFFLVFFGLLRKHKLYRVDFACARSISFSATTKSFRENWCIALLTSIIWQNPREYIVTEQALPNTCSISFSGFTKKMGNEIFSWNWCISLLTSLLWQYFLFTEWPLPNTCSTSFPAFTKIFFGKLLNKGYTHPRKYLLNFLFRFSENFV